MRFRNLLIFLSLLALMVPVSLAQGQSSPAQTAPQDSSSASSTTQQQQPNPTDTSGTAQQPGSATDTSATPQPPPVIQEPDASKVKHDGSEKDVDAIGNRKIGRASCRERVWIPV